jgi:hypothetical protein
MEMKTITDKIPSVISMQPLSVCGGPAKQSRSDGLVGNYFLKIFAETDARSGREFKQKPPRFGAAFGSVIVSGRLDSRKRGAVLPLSICQEANP